jgi:Immunity protein 27
MNKKLSRTETVLIGSWELVSGVMKQDSVSDRIQWLTDSCLIQESVDGENWSALYIDPEDGRHWELSYPQSHLQGGGPPTLKVIAADSVKQGYAPK